MAEPHERLQQARALAGYKSATDAADALGVARPTYYGHENGSRGFLDDASRYAKFFRVSYEWLSTGRGEPRAAPADSWDARIGALDDDEQAEIARFVEYLEARKTMKSTGWLHSRRIILCRLH